jgi:predicted transcriptional regulator of viral defense system
MYNRDMDETPHARGYALGRGITLASRLSDSGAYIFTTDDAKRIAPDVGLPESAVAATLRRLADAGWIVRLKRGLYAGTGRLPGGTDVHPFAVATAVVQPSAVSRWSALSHHGLTTQIPLTVTVTSPKTVMTPSMRGRAAEGRDSGTRHQWTIGSVGVDFVKVREDRFFGVEQTWVDQQFRVPIFDAERTVLDLFAYPRAFGGIDAGIAVLGEHGDDLDLTRLVRYTELYAAKSVSARLGWCAEHAGLHAASLDRLRGMTGPGLQLLDPTRPARGHRDGRWSLLDNVSPRSDG